MTDKRVYSDLYSAYKTHAHTRSHTERRQESTGDGGSGNKEGRTSQRCSKAVPFRTELNYVTFHSSLAYYKCQNYSILLRYALTGPNAPTEKPPPAAEAVPAKLSKSALPRQFQVPTKFQLDVSLLPEILNAPSPIFARPAIVPICRTAALPQCLPALPFSFFFLLPSPLLLPCAYARLPCLPPRPTRAPALAIDAPCTRPPPRTAFRRRRRRHVGSFPSELEPAVSRRFHLHFYPLFFRFPLPPLFHPLQWLTSLPRSRLPSSRRRSPSLTRTAMAPSPPRSSAPSCAPWARTPPRPSFRCAPRRAQTRGEGEGG